MPESSSESPSLSPSISPPPAIINSGKATVASISTASNSIVDMAGVSTTVDIVNEAEIVAFLSVEAVHDTNSALGYFVIDINSVESPEIIRKFTASNYASVGNLFRSGTLSAGTYTVKARYYTSAGILTVNNPVLVAFATEDSNGNYFQNVYDTVATDTSTSATLEDITGLIQNLVMDSTTRIFGAIVATISSNIGNTKLTLGINIGGEQSFIDRRVGGANNQGFIGVAHVTDYLSGTITCKGEISIANGTALLAPATLFAIEAGSEDLYEFDLAHADAFDDTTSSASLVDIVGCDAIITVAEEAHVMAIMAIDATCSGAADLQFAININGVDYETQRRTISNPADDAAIWIVARTTTPLAPGTYTVKGRWATNNGTASIDTNGLHLTVIALVNEYAGSPSQSPSASPSSSESVSESPSRSPSSTESPSVSPSESPSESPSISPSSSASPSESPSGSPSSSESPSASPSLSPSSSESPSESPSESVSESPSRSPSSTESPSESSSVSPSTSPSESPSRSPSSTESPSASPSASPSESPSVSPSLSPSASPSTSPSGAPDTHTEELTGIINDASSITGIIDDTTSITGQL